MDASQQPISDTAVMGFLCPRENTIRWWFEFVFWPTETVFDPVSTTRDNQDTTSGEPPSDVTTKDPFQDMTEQSSTSDYEDITHSLTIDEEEGETHSTVYSF